MSQAKSAEKVVQEIRRQTRRQFSAEEKIRIVLEGLRSEERIAAAATGTPRAGCHPCRRRTAEPVVEWTSPGRRQRSPRRQADRRPAARRWCADSAWWASSGRHVDHRDRRRVMISM